MATNEATTENATADEAVDRVNVVKEEGTTEPRSNSPDPSCPICLDNVTDAAFTDMCCHRFCFHCLVTWSRVKPECPLCKQRFTLILHNVRSWADYDQLPVAWPDPPSPALDASVFISFALQRPRFRYRTTGGSWGWRLQDMSAAAGSNPLLPSSSMHNPLVPTSLVPSAVSYSPPIITPPSFPPPPSTFIGNTVATEWRRRRQVSAVEFRRNVYRQNRWVCPPQPRPGTPLRVRESTPAFYRNNAAQVHRLIPWLHRELLVLLDVGYDYQEVCQMICHAITNIPIRSPRFQSMLWPYLGERTAQFCHEFYHFAISPYDMLAYDLRAEYVSRMPPGCEMPLPSDQENNSDSSDIEVIEPENREEPIEISDDEVVGVEVGGDNDSDASVEIISTLPPLAEREPEIIDLVDDSGSDMEMEAAVSCPVTRPSCSEERRDERLRNRELPYYKEESSSDGLPSVSSLRPGCIDGLRDRLGERLRHKDLLLYKDDSSTSEEEVPRRKQLRKRKKKCIKPLKKRKRIVEDYSSSEEDQDRCHKSDNDSDQSHLNIKQTCSKVKSVLSSTSSSPSQEKRSSSKSSSSNSTESSSRSKSDCSNRNSPEPSTSRGKFRDRKRSLEPHTATDLQMKYESGSPQDFTPSSPLPSPYLSLSMNMSKEQSETPKQGELDNFLLSSMVQWPCPESSDLLDDQLLNCYRSRSRTPPKPRLKSVVMKVEPKEEAGCSNWHSHNLRQRKFTSHAYTPYFSSSDSDF